MTEISPLRTVATVTVLIHLLTAGETAWAAPVLVEYRAADRPGNKSPD